jgi:hypothetical protein
VVVWTLLMFGPTATYPHQGPYVTEELALAGSCMAFWCVRPVLGWLFVAVRMVWTVVVFAWLTPSGQAIAMGGREVRGTGCCGWCVWGRWWGWGWCWRGGVEGRRSERRVSTFEEAEKYVSVRLDPGVLDWLKSRGRLTMPGSYRDRSIEQVGVRILVGVRQGV